MPVTGAQGDLAAGGGRLMQRDWVGRAVDNFRKGGNRFEPRVIVIQLIVGSLESAGLTFRDTRSSVSAPTRLANPAAPQFVEEADTTFHAGTVVEPK